MTEFEFDENAWFLSTLSKCLAESGMKPDDFSNEAEIQEFRQRTIQGIASNLVKEVLDNKAARLENRHLQLSSVRHTIQEVWGDALEGLEIYIMVCDEIGDAFVDRYRSPTLKYDTIEALARLHAQASLVASETLVLLRAGYVSGANARWRTLHELAVTSWFIRDKGDEVAERYLMHDRIEAYKIAAAHKGHTEAFDDDLLSDEQFRELEKTKASLIARFGPGYGGQHGWAASALGIKCPSFADIEKAVNFQEMRAIFKLISHSIHARPDGMSDNISFIEGKPKAISRGTATIGLADSGQGAAYSLFHVTFNLLLTQPSAWHYMLLEIIDQMLETVAQQFVDARDCSKAV